MKIKCLICGDIIESKSIHDLVTEFMIIKLSKK